MKEIKEINVVVQKSFILEQKSLNILFNKL